MVKSLLSGSNRKAPSLSPWDGAFSGLSQSFSTLGLGANCALPNLSQLNQRWGFDRLRTQTYNQKLDRAAFSHSSPTGRKKFATGPVKGQPAECPADQS